MPKSRKEQNLEATRAALMAVARKHFARDGYSDAEIAAIAADARVTTARSTTTSPTRRGCSWRSRKISKPRSCGRRLRYIDDDPWQRLRRGFEKLIDLCAAPAVQRIVFVEAPQVVGPEAWRKIELQYAFGTLRNVLVSLREARIIKPYPIDLIARTLLACCTRRRPNSPAQNTIPRFASKSARWWPVCSMCSWLASPRDRIWADRRTNASQKTSPDPRQQTITHPALIFAVARQMVHEEAFLIHQPPYQHGHQREHDQHAPGSSRAQAACRAASRAPPHTSGAAPKRRARWI